MSRRFRGGLATLCVTFSAAAMMAFSSSGLAAGAASAFKTGIYKGKTSQGFPLEFAIKLAACPTKRRLCLYTPNDSAEAYISEPCTAGSSTNSYVDLVSIPVPSSGVVHNTSSGFSKVVVKLKVSPHGTISGTFEATTLPGAEYSCASGVVTFTAKRT